MNRLQERSEQLLAEPWLEQDGRRVEALAGRIRSRRRRVVAGCLAVALVVGVALVTTARDDDATSLRVGDDPTGRYEPGDIDVIVFLDPASPTDDIDLVERALVADPVVGQAWVLTSDDAYEQFACLFADAPEMIESVTPGILPTAFQIALVDGADSAQLELAQTKLAPVRVVHAGPHSAAEAQSEQLTGTSRPTDPACVDEVGRAIK